MPRALDVATLINSTRPTADFHRRIRVLLVRQRIEVVARALLCIAEGSQPDDRLHARVKARLLLLLAHVPHEKWSVAYRLARRAGAVHGETSDVLHSRRAFADVPEVLVREWEDLVEELERMASIDGYDDSMG